jgi:hypothetical protein
MTAKARTARLCIWIREMARGEMVVTINVEKMPDVIWQLRKEMATMLRREAESEADPRVSRKLERVAMAFEAGVIDG